MIIWFFLGSESEAGGHAAFDLFSEDDDFDLEQSVSVLPSKKSRTDST